MLPLFQFAEYRLTSSRIGGFNEDPDEQRQHVGAVGQVSWSVRTRIAVACLLCAVVPLVAYAMSTYLRASGTLRDEQHTRFVEREVAVGRALDDLTVAELQAIGAYARWGRFAGAVRAGDNQWLRGQLETLASRSGGTAQVLSTDGRLLLSSGRQLSSTALWRLPEVQDIVDDVIVDMPASGFETVGGRLVIVTAEYITPPGRPDDKVGLLVISRPVDGQALADVEAATDVRVSIVRPQVADALTGASPRMRRAAS